MAFKGIYELAGGGKVIPDGSIIANAGEVTWNTLVTPPNAEGNPLWYNNPQDAYTGTPVTITATAGQVLSASGL